MLEEKRVAATQVGEVQDEPILSESGRAIGVRLSFVVSVHSSGSYAITPSLHSPDGVSASLQLPAGATPRWSRCTR